jgi:DNA-binding HxlR family transcriptional regulator
MDSDPSPDPRIGALVNDLIGAVADKWTMLVLEDLEEHGTARFTAIGAACPASARRC